MKIALFFLLLGSKVIAQNLPDAGIKKYGNVQFADSLHHKYPIDTPKHIRAAWAYIHRKKNAETYSRTELATIFVRISKAARKAGIHLKAGNIIAGSPTLR